jgi:hypothetical protein
MSFRYNNIYHSLFYRLFLYVLRKRYEPLIHDVLLGNMCFLTRLIEHYRTWQNHSGCKGYILLMCNAIKLFVSQLPIDDVISQLFQSHELWNEFLPVLQ